MNWKLKLTLWLVVLLMILYVFISYQKLIYVSHFSLINKKEITNIRFNENWEKFRRELNILKNDSKIEDVNFILYKDKIKSLNFHIVDKTNSKYIKYDYRECLSCEFKEDNGVHISKYTMDTYSEYENLIKAKEFFLKMDTLTTKGLLNKNNKKYTMIRSSGMDEEIGYEGDYLLLDDQNHIRKIKKIVPQSNISYSGFNLIMMVNNNWSEFSSNYETTTVFIKNYQENDKSVEIE